MNWQKLGFRTLSVVSSILAITSIRAQVYQNDCYPITHSVDTTGFEINWQQFPDFNLPFNVIYHGHAPSDSMAHQLKKGFSHIAGSGMNYIDTIWPNQRAYTWTGIANADNWAQITNQPWRMIKSPWGNDIAGYRQKWNGRLKGVANGFYKYHPPAGSPQYDIVVADLEWAFHTDADILSIKNDPLVPSQYQSLSNADFIKEYKKAMAALYGESLLLARDSLHPSVTLSSYNELPVRRTWWAIDDTTWQGWITDPNNLDYLVLDSTGAVNSDFYNLHDVIGPSIYNFYNIDSTFGGRDYLGYNLFTMEVNAAWSNKDQLVYCWLNYHDCCSSTEAVQPWVAEATAVFPFMSGAKTLYPWIPVSPHGYDVYEYFVHGLHRLSAFNHFFDGNEAYVATVTGHESFVNNLPIWRGVVNDNEILIAAQNPYAAPSDTTFIPVAYASWNDTIALIGNELFLCSFEMWGLGTQVAERPVDVKAYPNPCNGILNFEVSAKVENAWLIDLRGRVVKLNKTQLSAGMVDLSAFPSGMYVLEFKTDKGLVREKIMLQN